MDETTTSLLIAIVGGTISTIAGGLITALILNVVAKVFKSNSSEYKDIERSGNRSISVDSASRQSRPSRNRSTTTYKLAPLWRRFWAAIIDWFLITMTAMPIIFMVWSSIDSASEDTNLNTGSIAYICSIAVMIIYLWYSWTNFDGKSVGKMMFGIRVVKRDGSGIRAIDVLLRVFGYLVNSVAFALGWLWILIDKNNQGWHDKIASTYVIKD